MTAPRTRAEREAFERTPEAQKEHERAVVAEHYEHDPRIFELVLDRRLTYSTGIFEHLDEDLETAQARKRRRILELLSIRRDERVLDIGCGWGSLLLYLAETTQGQFQGITLSELQREEALARARQSGVAERVGIAVRHLEDLDAVPESYDVVMFSGSIVHMHNREAVHQLVGRLLRPGGRLLISDCYFPVSPRGNRESTATQYIFVHALGYCRLLHLSEELAFIERAGLDVTMVQDLTSSYVLTIKHWIDNVRRNREAIDRMAPGFSRVLQTYMTVGRASFARRTALEYLIVAVKGRAHISEVTGE